MIEQALCPRDIAAAGEVVRCPEAANAKGAFLPLEWVVSRRVAIEETVASEPLPNPLVG